MRSIRKTFYSMLAVCMLITACTQVGLAPADSFDQKLAYGYGAVAAVRTSAAQAVTAGTISTADARSVLAVTDTARATLDAAGTANVAGDTSTALGKLAAASALIAQLQQFLTARGVK